MYNDSGFNSFCSETSFESLPGTSKEPSSEKGILCLGRFNSFDSVLSASEASVKTQFSGLEADDSVISDDSSFIVPESSAIVWSEKEIDIFAKNRSDVNFLQFRSELQSAEDLKQQTSLVKRRVLGNITNTKTPDKQYENKIDSGISPDLFANDSSQIISESPKVAYQPKHCVKDLKLLQKIKGSLSGLAPPSHLTVVQFSAEEMLDKINANINLFWGSQAPKNKSASSTLISDEFQSIFTEYPGILDVRFHGLHYNRSRVSEDIEHLCTRYGDRYVGAETQSSCTVFKSAPLSSPKNMKPRWSMKSPGRRLSHLARRRITFSSSSSLQNSSSRTRQILVDAKKLSLVGSSDTAKKVSPNSAKKNLDQRLKQASESDFENISSVASNSSTSSNLSYKRVLFQSPDKDCSNSSSMFSLDSLHSRRSLFSPPKTDFLNVFPRKRKPDHSEGPSALKIARSISFNGNGQSKSSLMQRYVSHSQSNSAKPKPDSLILFKEKFKLAVYDALRLHDVSLSNPNCKIYASTLARVTKKIFTDLPVKTSEELKRVARYHAHSAIKGKSFEDIVRESDYLRNRTKSKPAGYVKNPEDDDENKENVAADKKDIIASIEKRRQQAGAKTRFVGESRIDRIRRVISFDDGRA